MLDALTNEDIADLAMVVATPEALATLLKRRHEVIEVRRAFDRGSITSDEVRHFISHTLGRFEAQKKFAGDIILSALAVALETNASEFAEEYLQELSRLKLRELPMSSRVANAALRSRGKVLSSKTTRKFRLAGQEPVYGDVKVAKNYRVTSEQSRFSYPMAA